MATPLRAERKKAEKEGRTPDFWPLLDLWGGVKLVYRKRLIDAPSYRLNHEEVEKAFEEGIFFSELFEPQEVELDRFGSASAIVLKKAGTNETISLRAKTVLVAAGTNPNTVLQREEPEHFELDGKYFKAVDDEGNPVKPERVAKPKDVRVLMHSEAGRTTSFFGDLHPSFAGNVVKAMASAKQGYPVVTRILAKEINPATPARRAVFAKISINGQLRASVHAVNRLTPTIIEVVIKAPLAASAFQPGQFYRLQNFEANAAKIAGTTLAMEGLAMTGAWVDKEAGLLSVIVLEMGGSSDLCAYLNPGEPVILMGPTGMPTEIPEKETVMLVAAGFGAMRCCFPSAKRCGRRAGKGALFRRATKKPSTVTRSTKSRPLPTWWCGPVTMARLRRDARRTKVFTAISSKPSRPTARGRSERQPLV